ncbi:MAG: T9SS type A sorting domain-containing protein, partial [Saprospiraceae bacterium]
NQNITVFDNTPPSIICPGNVTVSCASLVPPVNLNLGVITNACGGTSTVSLLSDVISNQTCTNRFTLTRTYLATDACAQSASCMQVITVLDNTPPVITLPNGQVNGSTLDVQCFGQDPNWDLPVFGINDVTTADNCTGAVTVTFAQVVEDEGTCETDGYINLFRLTWTATDECGNSSTAFLFLALIDTIPPVIHGIPADITVNCDSIPLPPTIVFATDECLCACVLFVSETQPISGCADGQVILRTWTAKDRCGNQTTETQHITLVNNQPPTLQLLQPEMTGLIDGSTLEYTCSEGGIPAYINVMSAVSIVSTSTCGDAVNVTFDRKVIDANNCDFSGYIQQQILHWEAVDLCGNVASMTVTVNLIDNQAPELIGVPSLACIDDPLLANVDAIDDCGEAHVRFWDFNIPNPCGEGSAVRRTYEAYDDCGNMTRDTAILIPNGEAQPNLEFVNPMLDSLGAGEVILLNCAAHDQQMTLFGTQDVVSNDPCAGPVNLSFAETLLSSGDCSAGSNVALMQLLWTATDVCGNLSTLTAIASIEDKTSPVFVDFRAVIGIGCNDSLPVYVASDNCGSVTITTSDRYFYSDCPSKYYIEREVTATDPCGNATVAFQTINVGSGGPVITGITEEICDDLSIPNVTAFDKCAGVFVDVTMVQDTLEEACRGLVIQRTWMAVDACGDTTTIIQHIFVGDTIAPVILIPSYSILYQFLDINHNVVYISQEELMKKMAAFDENTVFVSDDCGLVIIPVFTLVVTHDDCLLTGFSEHRVYTWMATDICGNSSLISITIDIIDDMPPVITGVPNDTMIVCAPLPVAPVVQADDTALPVTVIYTESISPDDGTGIFIVTRTWTSTDACGNTSVTIQHITWIPNSFLVCTINVPEVVECNSHGVIITSDVTGGFGPYTYEWKIVGNKCFIQGGQGTPDITIYMGWADVKIILIVTDAFGCQSMCMYLLHCLEPGEIPIISIPVYADPDVNPNAPMIIPASVTQEGQSEYLKELNLWPNPAKGTINLSFKSSVEEEVVYSFVNFLGQVILSDRIVVQKGLNTRTIDIDRIPGGSYLMEVKSEKEMLTKVIVIMP